MINNNLIAIFSAILSNILWGSTFMGSKVILKYIPPATATVIRFFIAILFFIIISQIKKNNFQFEIFKNKFKQIFFLSLVGYTGLYSLQMGALKYITSSQSASIMLLAPIFTLILNSIINRKILLKDILFISLACTGASIILFDQYQIDFSGIQFQGLILTVFSSFCLGASVVQTKLILDDKNDSSKISVFNLTFYSILLGTIGLLPVSLYELFIRKDNFILDTISFVWLLYLGILCSVLAFLLWNWSVKFISPIVVAISMYLKTPVALFMGYIFLSEKLSPLFYFGVLLIFVSLFSNQLLLLRSKK